MNNLLGLVMGLFVFKTFKKSDLNQKVKKTAFYSLVCICPFLMVSSVFGSSIDDERLLKSLIERGIICAELSPAQKQQALQEYLQKKMQKKPSNQTPKAAADHTQASHCQPEAQQVSP